MSTGRELPCIYILWRLTSVSHTNLAGATRTTQCVWCDFDRASLLICGNKMPTRCKRGFYCRSYCFAEHVSGTTIPIIRSSRVLYSGVSTIQTNLFMLFSALISVNRTYHTKHRLHSTMQNSVMLQQVASGLLLSFHGQPNWKLLDWGSCNVVSMTNWCTYAYKDQMSCTLNPRSG